MRALSRSAMKVWQENCDFLATLKKDPYISKNIDQNKLEGLFDYSYYTKNIDLIFFPIGDKIELDAFDKVDKGFVEYLRSAINLRYENLSKDVKTLKLWHIFGSETRNSKLNNSKGADKNFIPLLLHLLIISI